MESVIEKIHPPWIIFLSSTPGSINIKIQKNNSKENIYENPFTLKKLQKSKVFSNKKNTKDIIKGIIYFKEHDKIIYEEKNNILKFILISYNKRVLELVLNQKTNIEYEKKFNNLNLILIKSLESHNHRVSCVSIFPSGNFISVSCDKSIKIWDKINYNLLQCIEEAHDNYINYVSIKDENNFATCSRDQNIKLWIKNENENEKEKENKYILNYIIKNAHESWIFKIIYLYNGKIISCSYDKTIKIWETKNNTYINIKIINHPNIVYSILLVEDKDLLISSGEFGTTLFNSNNYNCIFEFNDVKCWNWNSLCKLDENTIIVGGTHGIIKVISLNDKKVIKEINNGFNCWGICFIDNFNIFMTVGEGKNAKIYKKNNYEFVKDINDIHTDDIEGIIQFNKNENIILTYSWDKMIKIWKIN